MVDDDPFISAAKIQGNFNESHSKELSKTTIKRILMRNDLKSYIAKKKPLLTKKWLEAESNFAGNILKKIIPSGRELYLQMRSV